MLALRRTLPAAISAWRSRWVLLIAAAAVAGVNAQVIINAPTDSVQSCTANTSCLTPEAAGISVSTVSSQPSQSSSSQPDISTGISGSAQFQTSFGSASTVTGVNSSGPGSTTPPSQDNGRHNNKSALVGGCIALILLLIALIFFLRRRRRMHKLCDRVDFLNEKSRPPRHTRGMNVITPFHLSTSSPAPSTPQNDEKRVLAVRELLAEESAPGEQTMMTIWSSRRAYAVDNSEKSWRNPERVREKIDVALRIARTRHTQVLPIAPMYTTQADAYNIAEYLMTSGGKSASSDAVALASLARAGNVEEEAEIERLAARVEEILTRRQQEVVPPMYEA